MNWTRPFARRTGLMPGSAIRDLLPRLADPGMISLAGGLPAPELFPVDAIREATDRVLRDAAPAALQYGETAGLVELRDALAARFSRPDLPLTRENLLITSGSQQALDLVGRILLNPGEVIAVESPTYPAALAAWRPLEVRFAPLASRESPDAFYLIPNFRNPTGTVMSRDEREHWLEQAAATGAPVIEDDPYGELHFETPPPPTLQELNGRTAGRGAGDAPVIRLGTCSKILAPGLRVGWVIAPPPVIAMLIRVKQGADLHTSTFNQRVVWELLRMRRLEEHVAQLRLAYRLRRDALLEALAAAGLPRGTTWTRPEGGLFLLVSLPAGIDTRELLPRALARGVAFVPGQYFHADGTGSHTLRLNFSHAAPDALREGIRRLAAALAARAGSRGEAGGKRPAGRLTRRRTPAVSTSRRAGRRRVRTVRRRR